MVYDIVRFSEMPQRDLVLAVEDLRHAVRRSLEAAGLVRWADSDGLWYAPAGDGGVVVFGPERGRAAWSFVQALLAHTANRVPVRLGVASGMVVIVDGNLPVGKGVFQAERLSGLADVGQPCVSQRFWQLLDDHEKESWTSKKIPEDPKGLKVQLRASVRKQEGVPPKQEKRIGLKPGHIYSFICLQIDIAGHSKLADPERVLHQAKERFQRHIASIVATYGGQSFKWEGDGGAFLFPVTDGHEFDEAVLAGFRILESLPSINEELRLTAGLGQALSVRVSLDTGTAIYDTNPGLRDWAKITW